MLMRSSVSLVVIGGGRGNRERSGDGGSGGSGGRRGKKRGVETTGVGEDGVGILGIERAAER